MKTNTMITLNNNSFDISKIDENALTIVKSKLATIGISEKDSCYNESLTALLINHVTGLVSIARCKAMYDLRKASTTNFKAYCEKLNIDNYSNCNKDANCYERILSDTEYAEMFKYCSISVLRVIGGCKNIKELVKAIKKNVIAIPTMTKNGLTKGSTVAELSKAVTLINAGVVDITKSNVKNKDNKSDEKDNKSDEKDNKSNEKDNKSNEKDNKSDEKDNNSNETEITLEMLIALYNKASDNVKAEFIKAVTKK